MPTKSKQRKFTPAQIKAHIRRIQKAIEKNKRQKKGKHSTTVTSGEIEKKLKRVNSPMIIQQIWNSATPPGGTCNYSVMIYNPDPTDAEWLLAHVWVGSGNVDPTVGTFLSNVDIRFPRLTEPAFDGLKVAAGTSATLDFAIKIPSKIEKTHYLGNTCLMRVDWHDVGTYLDRGFFLIEVS